MMLALSLLALKQLSQVPMPVLYGVFLFMGMSIAGNVQFWKRIQMFLQQSSLYAPSPATDHMEHRRIHIFTIVQIFLFGLVCLVQNTDLIAMGFPLLTLLCIPIRLYLLPKFFEGWELLLLDGEEHIIKKWLRRKAKVSKQIHLLAMNGRTGGSELMNEGNLVGEELAWGGTGVYGSLVTPEVSTGLGTTHMARDSCLDMMWPPCASPGPPAML